MRLIAVVVCVSLICCLPVLAIPPELVYDYIFAGGGGGACITARKIAEHPNNYRVLIIEKGIGADAFVDNDLGTHNHFVEGPDEVHYHSTAQPFALNRKHYFPTFEGIGGSTRIYGATAVTGSCSYYDQKMPVGYKCADMLNVTKSWQDHYCHYLNSSYTGISAADCQAYHGKDGPMPIGTQHHESVTPVINDLLATSRSVLGTTHDYNGATRVGAGYEDVYKRLANPSDPASVPTKISAYTAFLPQSFRDSHPNLEIRLMSKAVRLVYSRRDPTRVVGVEYIAANNSDIVKVYAKREVIVSLGVVGTPRFLQANGIGSNATLTRIGATSVAINNAVGANLTAHQGFIMGYKLNTSLAHDPAHWSNNVLEFFFKTPYTTLEADIQVSVLEGVYSEGVAWEDRTPSRDLIFNVRHLLETGNAAQVGLGTWQKYIGFVVFNVDPVAVGSIEATSVNIDRHPTMNYGWAEAAIQGNGDLAKLRSAIATLRNLMLNTSFTSKYNVTEIVPGNLYLRDVAPIYTELSGAALQAKADEMFIRYQLTHFYHMTGSCRLGEATDLDGRVRGAKRLRVCDNSLLPQPDGNPTGTLMTVCSEIGRRIVQSSVDASAEESLSQHSYFEN